MAVSLALVGAAALGGWGSAGRTPPGNPSPASYTAAVRAVSLQVVEVRTARATGSGIVYDARGDIVTSAHLVGRARKVPVVLPDGSTSRAVVLGTSPDIDLAVLRLKGPALRPAEFANSSNVQVGDLVLAVGHPASRSSRPTRVLAIPAPGASPRGNALSAVILTSDAIDHGRAGGALVNVSGQVVGVPTSGSINPRLGSVATSRVGFAVSSNAVRAAADKLIASARVNR